MHDPNDHQPPRGEEIQANVPQPVSDEELARRLRHMAEALPEVNNRDLILPKPPKSRKYLRPVLWTGALLAAGSVAITADRALRNTPPRPEGNPRVGVVEKDKENRKALAELNKGNNQAENIPQVILPTPEEEALLDKIRKMRAYPVDEKNNESINVLESLEHLFQARSNPNGPKEVTLRTFFDMYEAVLRAGPDIKDDVDLLKETYRTVRFAANIFREAIRQLPKGGEREGFIHGVLLEEWNDLKKSHQTAIKGGVQLGSELCSDLLSYLEKK